MVESFVRPLLPVITFYLSRRLYGCSVPRVSYCDLKLVEPG